MAFDGYVVFDGVELVNVARLSALGLPSGVTRVPEATSAWISYQTGSDFFEYSDIAYAPWYDEFFATSTEFLGLMPLDMRGLDDSTSSSNVQEYLGDGGNTGRPRNATLSIVANMVIVAKTDKGAEFGLRWLKDVLRKATNTKVGRGVILEYFQSRGEVGMVTDIMHRRAVACTRSPIVTRKKRGRCLTEWWVTFTLTAGDPYEYGPRQSGVFGLGGAVPTGDVLSYGQLTSVETSCPVYDYSPIYDPLYPALVPSPTAPEFLPAGWDIQDGREFKRYWARLRPYEPSNFNLVPFVLLSADSDARMIRLTVWPSTASPDDDCGFLHRIILTYLPSGTPMFVDGEVQAGYVSYGGSPSVRRIDSLLYSDGAAPIIWDSIDADPNGFMITLDTFARTPENGGGYEGSGTVRASMSFIPRTD